MLGPKQAPENEAGGGNRMNGSFAAGPKGFINKRINPIKEVPGIGCVVDEFSTLADLTDDYAPPIPGVMSITFGIPSAPACSATAGEWTQDLQSNQSSALKIS